MAALEILTRVLGGHVLGVTPEDGQKGEGEGGHVNCPLFKDVGPPDYLTFQFSFIERHCPILKKEKSCFHMWFLKGYL